MQAHNHGRRTLFLAALTFLLALPLRAQNDPDYQAGKQPYLWTINADHAWNITKGSTSTKIAVVGIGGVLPTHEDLAGKLTVVNNRYDGPIDPPSATAAAGVASALTNNGRGIAGVDWNARLLSYDAGKIIQQGTDATVGINLDHWDDDVRDAVSRGAQIILAPYTVSSENLPRKFPTPKTTVYNTTVKVDYLNYVEKLLSYFYDANSRKWNDGLYAFRDAYVADRTIIAPTGDFEGVAAGIPAGLADDNIAIGVGGVESDGSVYQYSGYSPLGATPDRAIVDVVAPFRNVHTTLNSGNNAYGPVSSIAVSAGMVAGVAGLMKAVKPDLRPDDIKQILRRTARKTGGQTGFEQRRGFGWVDAEAAVKYVRDRSFARGIATSGTKTLVSSRQNISVTSSGWNVVAPGVYSLERYKVRFTASVPVGAQDPHVWIRYDDTCGWSPSNPNDQGRYARIVSQTSTTITFETWIYRGYNAAGDDAGWLPCQNATVGYTISFLGSPPPAPTGVRISNTGSIGAHPILTWNASSGATGYKVYRCYSTSAACTNYTYIGPTTATSYEDFDYLISSSCGGGLFYQVRATNAAGSSPPAGTDGNCGEPSNSAAEGALAAQEGSLEAVPTEYALEAAYPNPFNPTTEIRFALPEAADVRLTVYDALGREVARLVDGPVGAGYRHATFDASGLPSGMYLYRLEAKGAAEVFAKTGRMVLVK